MNEKMREAGEAMRNLLREWAGPTAAGVLLLGMILGLVYMARFVEVVWGLG